MIVKWKTKPGKYITKLECKKIVEFIKKEIKKNKQIEIIPQFIARYEKEEVKEYSISFILKSSILWSDKFDFWTEHSFKPKNVIFERIDGIEPLFQEISYTGELKRAEFQTNNEEYFKFINKIFNGMQKITNNKLDIEKY